MEELQSERLLSYGTYSLFLTDVPIKLLFIEYSLAKDNFLFNVGFPHEFLCLIQTYVSSIGALSSAS